MSTARKTASKLALACTIAVLCWGCARSEEDIREDVRARLDSDQTLAPLALSIEVKRQVVYLSGMTPTADEQQRAVAAANAVRGVKLVVNDMRLNNTVLADRVKDALTHDAVVGKIPIAVEADGTLIRLSSDETTRGERERAIEVTSAVEGVTKVEDRMK